jgi:hypothetical protein
VRSDGQQPIAHGRVMACRVDAASSSSSTRPLMVPISVLTDSYKASHFLMYPEAELMVAYGQTNDRVHAAATHAV